MVTWKTIAGYVLLIAYNILLKCHVLKDKLETRSSLK